MRIFIHQLSISETVQDIHVLTGTHIVLDSVS